ncbi:VenA family class IV lanthipeptide [Streptomyces sp. SP17BM10]|nr:VenA family class IV lanthipeptide [Streptomyces sp. SP17BM10]MEE1787781.1 VenA family class IV lanthipeptide [Streptomyces sp. SP17BM10]
MENMVDFETDLAALQELPESESVELTGHGAGCQYTCLVLTCLIFTIN